MSRFLIILISIFFSSQAFSQFYKTDSISQSKISELSFFVGNWEGDGWMMGMDGNKNEFRQTEKIEFKLDSTAILIEGKGFSNGEVIHNAMAVVTYNKEQNQFDFQSYLQNGMKNTFKGEIKENKFYWYPNPSRRYIIWLNEKGQWYETGEMNRNGEWFQFFEMTLDKVE